MERIIYVEPSLGGNMLWRLLSVWSCTWLLRGAVRHVSFNLPWQYSIVLFVLLYEVLTFCTRHIKLYSILLLCTDSEVSSLHFMCFFYIEYAGSIINRSRIIFFLNLILNRYFTNFYFYYYLDFYVLEFCGCVLKYSRLMN